MPPCRSPRVRPSVLPAVALAVVLAAGGCGERGRNRDLALADLGPGEERYVRRVVVLERAKAVALVDRPRGDALLDSLAAAWGDSSLERTVAGLPADPARAAAVGRLLEGVLRAEQDSLVLAPRPGRLAAPLPEPVPPQEGPEAAREE